MAVKILAGVEVEMTTMTVVDGTKPVSERYYYGSRIPINTKCYNEQTKRYCNVELFQPVIYDKECSIPAFDPKWIEWDNPAIKNRKLIRINYPYSYKAWWYEQRRRCLEGYTVGGVHITGEFYFYLNFWRIRGKKRGVGYITPKFLDIQKELFDIVDKARRDGKNVLTLKRRQVGFSECYACMIAHEYTFLPMSAGLIVGGEDEYALTTMRKLIDGLDAFHPTVTDAGREFYKRRKSGLDRDDLIECGIVNTQGARMGYLSKIYAVTTKDNEQAANGKTPTFCLLEEAGINPLLNKVYNMIQPGMQEQGLQDGRIMVVNGTGGNMEAGAKLLKTMFYHPDDFGIMQSDECYEEGLTGTAHFFPAWKWHVIDHDGNSYKDAGLEDLTEKRRLGKMKITELKTQFPFTPSEAFTLSGQCPFNVVKLEAQLKHLNETDAESLLQWGRIEWIYADSEKQEGDSSLKARMEKRKIVGVEWVPCPQDKEMELDHDGDLMYPICIVEHPESPKGGARDYRVLFTDVIYRGLYKAGMDPYNKDEASESAYSSGSVVIAKGYLDHNKTHNIFPATMTWRPHKKDKFYDMAVKLQCYYSMARILIEWSNDAPLDWYKNNGWESLLKERPLMTQADMIDSNTVNRYGIDPNTKHVWEERYAQFIEDYFNHMLNPRQVEKALAYRKRKGFNCDETIAHMLAWEHLQDDIYVGYKVRNTGEKPKTVTMTPMGMGYTMSGGRITNIN